MCRYVACVTSSCGSSILLEETAKAIAALHPAVRPRVYLGWFAWSALPETLVRSSLVIVLDEPRPAPSPDDAARRSKVVEHLAAYCPLPVCRYMGCVTYP